LAVKVLKAQNASADLCHLYTPIRAVPSLFVLTFSGSGARLKESLHSGSVGSKTIKHFNITYMRSKGFQLLVGAVVVAAAAEAVVRIVEALEAKDARYLVRPGCRLCKVLSLKKDELPPTPQASEAEVAGAASPATA
jgi:hypothetical protein